MGCPTKGGYLTYLGFPTSTKTGSYKNIKIKKNNKKIIKKTSNSSPATQAKETKIDWSEHSNSAATVIRSTTGRPTSRVKINLGPKWSNAFLLKKSNCSWSQNRWPLVFVNTQWERGYPHAGYGQVSLWRIDCVIVKQAKQLLKTLWAFLRSTVLISNFLSVPLCMTDIKLCVTGMKTLSPL